jgi:hypothetical protein
MARRNFDIDHIDPRWEEGRDYQLVCGFEKDPLNFAERDSKLNSAKSNRFLPWRNISDEIGQVPCNPGDLAYFLVGADIENDIPGEWVLMEFLSEEWFEASLGTCSRSHRKVPVDMEALFEGQRRFRESNSDRYNEVINIFVDAGQKWIKENKELHTDLVREGRRKFVSENPDWEKERTNKAKEGFKEWYNNLSEEEVIERGNTISFKTKEAMKKLPPEKKQKMMERGRDQAQKRYQCLVTGYTSTAQWVTIHQRKLGIDPKPENRIQIN